MPVWAPEEVSFNGGVPRHSGQGPAGEGEARRRGCGYRGLRDPVVFPRLFRLGKRRGSHCGFPPKRIYVEGTEVTLSANPAESSLFTGWDGDLAGTESPATLAMDGDRTVTAAFALKTFCNHIGRSGRKRFSINDGPMGRFRHGHRDPGQQLRRLRPAGGRSACRTCPLLHL